MKTTIEIPDPLFRKAKSKAAERDQTLKELVTEALQEKLAAGASNARPGEPEWMTRVAASAAPPEPRSALRAIPEVERKSW